MASKAVAEVQDEWMSVQQAMGALGLSRVKVLHLAVQGVLKSKHIANRTVIRRESVDAEIARRENAALEGGAAQ